MVNSVLRRRRVIIENSKDASTLRNKGYLGKNIGESLSLDLKTAFHLVKKGKIKVFYHNSEIGLFEIEKLLNPEELKRAFLYHFIREKGLKLSYNNGRSMKISKVSVFDFNETIDFSSIGKKENKFAIVDRTGDCLLYSVERINTKLEGKEEGEVTVVTFLKSRGLVPESGMKYGCQFRVYVRNSTHAKYLMSTGKIVNSNELISRVRIAHSVRKVYVQVVPKKEGREYALYSVKWIRV